jgi:hypothetical protein
MIRLDSGTVGMLGALAARKADEKLHEGIDIQVVSDRLKQSSTHVTREIYNHVTPPSGATPRNEWRLGSLDPDEHTCWPTPPPVSQARR